MPYTYLEDLATADIAFAATGKTLNELFQTAADAVLNVMIEDLSAVCLKELRAYEAEAEDIELLLFDFLNEIVYHKDKDLLLLRAINVSVESHAGVFKIAVIFKGEPLDPEKHAQRVDVKAVTFHKFLVEKRKEEWFARVILDI